WIPDDEMHYIDAFSFDDPEYFHHNYIDHERYAFRIIGSALDSLGLIYDVREIEPEMIRELNVLPGLPESLGQGAPAGPNRIRDSGSARPSGTEPRIPRGE
ncbi:MAG: hypothetical protein ABIK62_07585, partial [candidate division WOR-3 bacterium]